MIVCVNHLALLNLCGRMDGQKGRDLLRLTGNEFGNENRAGGSSVEGQCEGSGPVIQAAENQAGLVNLTLPRTIFPGIWIAGGFKFNRIYRQLAVSRSVSELLM